MQPPRVILFDFGDTLVETEPSYVERLRMAFEAEGVPVTYEDMERAYLEADWRSAAALVDRNPFPGEAWRELYMAIMLETLHIKESPNEFLHRAANRMTTIRPLRKLVKGAGEFIETCSQQGIKMAVLSNNDGRTREKSLEVGIADYFDIIVDSTVEGTPKPNPEFFRRALDRMNAAPEECLHVGDLLGCDVIGAQAAGIRAAWFHQRKYTPNAPVRPDFKVDGFAQLAASLGVGK